MTHQPKIFHVVLCHQITHQPKNLPCRERKHCCAFLLYLRTQTCAHRHRAQPFVTRQLRAHGDQYLFEEIGDLLPPVDLARVLADRAPAVGLRRRRQLGMCRRGYTLHKPQQRYELARVVVLTLIGRRRWARDAPTPGVDVVSHQSFDVHDEQRRVDFCLE